MATYDPPKPGALAPLITALLAKDPAARPTVEAVLAMLRERTVRPAATTLRPGPARTAEPASATSDGPSDAARTVLRIVNRDASPLRVIVEDAEFGVVEPGETKTFEVAPDVDHWVRVEGGTSGSAERGVEIAPGRTRSLWAVRRENDLALETARELSQPAGSSTARAGLKIINSVKSQAPLRVIVDEVRIGSMSQGDTKFFDVDAGVRSVRVRAGNARSAQREVNASTDHTVTLWAVRQRDKLLLRTGDEPNLRTNPIFVVTSATIYFILCILVLIGIIVLKDWLAEPPRVHRLWAVIGLSLFLADFSSTPPVRTVPAAHSTTVSKPTFVAIASKKRDVARVKTAPLFLAL